MKVSLFFMMVFLVTKPVFAESDSQITCFQLLEKRCQECHYLERVCQELEKKSKRKWNATLKRMVKRRGATLSKEEHRILLDCLSPPSPDVKKGCAGPNR
jgi:hypothetical protein